MFTQKELVQAQNDARAFLTKCTEYRALIAEHELPLSVDLTTLSAAIRAQLFAKLLAVDAGLKMRFEMLRTEEAQQKLITDTIDLAGYAIVQELGFRIRELDNIYGSLMLHRGATWAMPAREGLSLGYLASHHNLDLTTWLESELINWNGKEHVLAYFKSLGQQLSQMRSLVRATRDASANLHSVTGQAIMACFTAESIAGDIEPNEHYIFNQLIPALQQQGKLVGFPNNLK